MPVTAVPGLPKGIEDIMGFSCKWGWETLCFGKMAMFEETLLLFLLWNSDFCMVEPMTLNFFSFDSRYTTSTTLTLSRNFLNIRLLFFV